jgi:hypothetical protein
METISRPANEDLTGCDLARNVGDGVPLAVDEEEPTVSIPRGETMRKVLDERLR